MEDLLAGREMLDLRQHRGLFPRHGRGQAGTQARHLLQGLLVRGAAFLPGAHELTGLGAHFVMQAQALLLGLLAHGLDVAAGLFLLLAQAGDLLFAFGGQGIEAAQQGAGVLPVLQEIMLRTAQDAFRQAVLAGHVQGLAGAHLVVGQLEKGLLALRVEEHRSGPRAFARQGVGLEGREVGGGQHEGPFVQQAVQHALGQGRALGGVGSGTEFVQQHEAGAVQMLPGFGQMPDLGREGGNVVFQALFVTDEGIHAAEPGQV